MQLKIFKFIFVFLVFNNLQAILNINYLRNTGTVLNSNYMHLSVLNGALIYESGILFDIYKSGNCDATTKLVKFLFYKNHFQFAPTVSRNNPANYLNAENIAQLMCWIELKHYENKENNLESLELNLAKKAQLAYPKEFSLKPFRRHFKNFLNQIRLSLQENKYPKYTTQAILLAFLYHKVVSKQEILTYLETLNSKLPILQSSLLSNKSKALWPASKYKLEDYLNFNVILSFWDLSQLGNQNPQLFQYTVTTLIALRNYLGRFPTQIPQGYYAYNNNNITVPNCMETVIQEFCNAILYNQQTKKFDFTKLSVNIRPSDDLINFYLRIQSDATAVTKYHVGQYWMNLVSGKPNIEYVKYRYEMRPTIANLLTTLNYLFGTTAKNFNAFCQQISSDIFNIKCKITQQDSQDGPVDVLDFLCVNSIDSYHIIIYLNPKENLWHSWINIPERDNNCSNNFISQNLKNKLLAQISNLKDHDLEKLCLYRLLK